MELADDAGTTAMNPQSLPEGSLNLADLVGTVQSRFTELMAWHEAQQKQLEADRAVLDTQREQLNQELQRERDELADDRDALQTARQALEARWAEVEATMEALHHERDAVQAEQESLRAIHVANQQLATVLERERERLDHRVQNSLDTLAQQIRAPEASETGKGKGSAPRLAA